MAKLPPEEIKNRLASLSGWQLADNAIKKQLKFNDFMSAIAFVNRVAVEAEAIDHHPDITINYTRVTMALSTHSAGGITEKDFALAQQIDSLAKA
jgi:4a-hydroxytetrahydrobiopterin dehydratase